MDRVLIARIGWMKYYQGSQVGDERPRGGGFCGDDDEKTRTKVTDRFRREDGLVLVSTDASAEGLNLHEKCHHLIHLELPFNPNRLEQRNGRIDRYGQNKVPYVRYFFLRGTFEERILLRLIAKYERQRSILTFVPNTLGGVTTSTDAGTERLLKGLMEEDGRLFQDEETAFDFHNPDVDQLANPEAQELLEEIDRSLKGYEQAARTNTWLGDAGINAEESLSKEAIEARDRGDLAGSVELVRFVIDAIRLDGGKVQESNGIIEATLPPLWDHGLDDLPGYDRETRTARLTTDIDVTHDHLDRRVGYLGRSHPLVRRALDRVRNISFGGQTDLNQDRRASAVEADIRDPQLLLTYLGRVSSKAGREFEQVIAVKLSRDGTERTYLTPEEWLSLADREKAVSTTDVWKNHFSEWGEAARERGRSIAAEALSPIAKSFIEERTKSLEHEKSHHQEWLKHRIEEIVGPPPEVPQITLFEEQTETLELPAWFSLEDPAERLAAFASDKSTSTPRRVEADTALRVYRQRIEDLEARLDLSESEIFPLGLLMVVPEGSNGA